MSSSPKKDKKPVKINDLPVECLAEAIQYLGCGEITKMKIVCKKWYEAVNIVYNGRPVYLYMDKDADICDLRSGDKIRFKDLIKFKKINFIKIDNMPRSKKFHNDLIQLLKTNCKNLTQIKVHYESMESFDYTKILQTIVEYCPKLATFSSYGGIPKKYYPLIQQLQDRLKFLSLACCEDDHQQLIKSLQFKQLKTFKLTLRTNKFIEPCRELFNNSTIFQVQLTSIEIEMPSNVTILMAVNKLGGMCPNVEHLGLIESKKLKNSKSFDKLSSIVDAIILKFSKIDSLLFSGHMNKYETINDNNMAVFKLMSNFPKMHSLCLFHGLDFGKDNGFYNDDLLKILPDVSKNLQELRLVGMLTVSPEKLVHFLKDVPYLKKFALIATELICRNENDARLIGRTIFECRYLYHLQIWGFPNELSAKIRSKYIAIIAEEYIKDKEKKYRFDFLLTSIGIERIMRHLHPNVSQSQLSVLMDRLHQVYRQVN